MSVPEAFVAASTPVRWLSDTLPCGLSARTPISAFQGAVSASARVPFCTTPTHFFTI